MQLQQIIACATNSSFLEKNDKSFLIYLYLTGQAGESALVALGALTEENASSLDQLSADAGEEKTTWHPLTTRVI